MQVRVRTLTPLSQVTLQAENGVHLEKPPSTAVKKIVNKIVSLRIMLTLPF